MNKTLKITIQVVLTVVILFLAYEVYESVMKPVRFKKEVKIRHDKVVQNLKDIRSAELAYKTIYDSYTSSFDSLISFIQDGEIPVVKIMPDPNDTTFTKTITDTISFVRVGDSLFGRRPDFNLNRLPYVPYSQNEMFEIAADTIQKGGVEVSVIEVKAHYNVFLHDLDEQLVINKIKSLEDIDKYPGLKFGSLTEPSTDGNWE